MNQPGFAGAQSPLTPTDRQSFADDADRKRLNRVALTAYRALCEKWALSNLDAAALLGVSLSTWERLKKHDGNTVLSQDQMTRVSALVGIYKALNLLFADNMADRWINLPNRGPLFDRRTPVEAMKHGGIPHMIEVRRYVDAARGGL